MMSSQHDDGLPTIRLSAEPILKVMTEEERSKIGPARVQQMLDNGIRMFDADKMAVARGYHPFELWGDAWIKEYPNKIDGILEEMLTLIKEHGPMSKNQLFKLLKTRSSTDAKRKAIQEAVASGTVTERHALHGKRKSHVLEYVDDGSRV